MINIYMGQTPAIISAMRQSIENKDWPLLQAAAHKILSSFTILGFDKEYLDMIKRIQEYTGEPEQENHIREIVFKMEAACTQAYMELEQDLAAMNN